MTKLGKFVTILALVATFGLGLNYYAESQITRTPTIRENTFIANDFGIVIGHGSQLTTSVGAAEFQLLGTSGADASLTLARFAADATSPLIEFVKGRAASIGNTSIVSDNDVIGVFRWVPVDDTDLATNAAAFRAEVDDGSPADGDIGMAFVWQQMPGGGGSLTETMRLSAAGNLIVPGVVSSAQLTVDIDGGGGAEALAITSNSLNLTCTGAETILTITGGVSGQLLAITHEDADCTLDDTDVDTANQMDLVGANGDLTGAADLMILLYFNGTSWHELIRSQN